MINWRKHFTKSILVLTLMLSGATAIAQDVKGDPNNGMKLFKQNCSSCHALDKQVVGPPLKGVVDRVKKDAGLGPEWLHKWIKDNKALRASGDKYANEIFKKYNNTEMQVFPNLSEKDIDDILAYTTNPPVDKPTDGTAKDSTNVAGANGASSTAAESSSKTIILSLVAIAALLIWILFKLRELVKLNQSEDLNELNSTRIQSFSELYGKYKFVGQALMGLLAIFAAYGVWNWMMWIGVYKGYKPDQPIYFSHKIHAGENKIDCQLCHSGAKYGKVSEIPSVNVCMNCHKAISEYNGKYMEPGKDKAFYDGEIKKIYEHSGWDPAKAQYTKAGTPIQWTRIHNMPDFVYFNHSQHVIAGEQAIIKSFNEKNPKDQIDVVCKACHGKIDTMNVVQMANDFTMGWCIECHRTTEVDMGNSYNKEYFTKLHEKLKKQYGSGTKITVDAIGGIECGKCHY